MTPDPSSPRSPLFYALMLLAGYLTYLIVGPFLAALTWAAIFAILFYRVQVALARRIGPGRAALVTTLLSAIIIVGPALTLLSVLAREAPQAITYLQETSRTVPAQIERIWDAIRQRSPVALPEDPTALLSQGLQRAVAFLAPRAGSLLADFFATLGDLFAMLFALFFMLRDGEAMARAVRDLLPLTDADRDRLLRDTRDLVVASVGASMVVAATQGTIGAIAFWLLGLGAPVFWGVVMAFCALLPVVGAALVWVPAGLGLLVSGEIGRGVAMLLVGALGISMADNVLRPLLLSGRASVSGLVVFFGLLGGVAAFGFVGLVIGPIILVTTGNLLKMISRPSTADVPRRTEIRYRVRAPRERVYRAFLDANDVARWMVPDGMTSTVHTFEPREGGMFRISLTYDAPSGTGKTTANRDTFHGRFVQLVPHERIVEAVTFETDDPAMRGEMTITIALADADEGTEIVAVHDDLPLGLSPTDNEIGWRMSLGKLASLVET
jgi:predicted PurR-regulated permease PerM/uncharacterized protein YndB with AHSA1/START domain